MTAAEAHTFAPDDLTRMVRDIYGAVGVPTEAAAIVAEHQVESNLVGHDSHGVMKTADYVGLIERGQIDPAADIEVVSDGPGNAVLDAHWGLGFVATRRAVDLTLEKARRQGVAAATVRRQGHIGRLGAYSQRAAEHGMIGLVTADSGRAPKSVAPHGGRERRLGTNPLSIAVPSSTYGPVVLDMATATVAKGKVTMARNRREQLPPGWLVDVDGHPTTDPNAYDAGGALLPLGADQAHKGSGLSFMVEVLSGLLTGIGFGVDPDGFHNDGVFLATFDVGAFRPREAFEQDVTDFVDYLKATPPAEGHEEVLYPGEIERRRADQGRRSGISVDQRTWDQLRALADRLGVATALGVAEA